MEFEGAGRVVRTAPVFIVSQFLTQGSDCVLIQYWGQARNLFYSLISKIPVLLAFSFPYHQRNRRTINVLVNIWNKVEKLRWMWKTAKFLAKNSSQVCILASEQRDCATPIKRCVWVWLCASCGQWDISKHNTADRAHWELPSLSSAQPCNSHHVDEPKLTCKTRREMLLSPQLTLHQPPDRNEATAPQLSWQRQKLPSQPKELWEI